MIATLVLFLVVVPCVTIMLSVVEAVTLALLFANKQGDYGRSTVRMVR